MRLSGRNIRRNLLRHFLGRGFATFASLLLQIQVYDHICGAKMFRVTDETHIIFRDPFLGRWTFDSEIVARVLSLGKRSGRFSAQDIIWEVPLMEWTEVRGSKVSSKYIVISFIEILTIWWRYIVRKGPHD